MKERHDDAAAARGRARDPRRRPPRPGTSTDTTPVTAARMRIRLPLFGVALLLGTTTIALAAGGILSGSPVRTSHPSPPGSGIGAPIASSMRLLSISFPDPEGGVPWGVRSFRTTRGMICLQIGRLYHGSVGALVDGRFRAFSLSLPSWPTRQEPSQTGPRTIGGCRLPGETFAMQASNVPATGYVPHHPRRRTPTPNPAQVRFMAFGALGPSARSATYELKGHFHTVSVERGSGAFLIVLPVGPYSEPLSHALSAGGTAGEGPLSPGSPQGPVRHFTYDLRGHNCLISRRGTNTCRVPAMDQAALSPATHPLSTSADPRHRRSRPPQGRIIVRQLQGSLRGHERPERLPGPSTSRVLSVWRNRPSRPQERRTRPRAAELRAKGRTSLRAEDASPGHLHPLRPESPRIRRPRGCHRGGSHDPHTQVIFALGGGLERIAASPSSRPARCCRRLGGGESGRSSSASRQCTGWLTSTAPVLSRGSGAPCSRSAVASRCAVRALAV